MRCAAPRVRLRAEPSTAAALPRHAHGVRARPQQRTMSPNEDHFDRNILLRRQCPPLATASRPPLATASRDAPRRAFDSGPNHPRPPLSRDMHMASGHVPNRGQCRQTRITSAETSSFGDNVLRWRQHHVLHWRQHHVLHWRQHHVLHWRQRHVLRWRQRHELARLSHAHQPLRGGRAPTTPHRHRHNHTGIATTTPVLPQPHRHCHNHTGIATTTLVPPAHQPAPHPSPRLTPARAVPQPAPLRPRHGRRYRTPPPPQKQQNPARAGFHWT